MNPDKFGHRGRGFYAIRTSRFQDIGTRRFKSRFALTFSSNIRTVIKERYLPGLLLIKRNFEGGLQLASIGLDSLELAKIHFEITGHKRLALKSEERHSETTNKEDEVAVSDKAPLVDIATFM